MTSRTRSKATGQSSAELGAEPPLRILIVAWSNVGGGAATATNRIFTALEKFGHEFGLEVHLRTIKGVSQSPRHKVGAPDKSRVFQILEKYVWLLRRGPRHFFFGAASFLPTTADVPTGLGREISLHRQFDAVNFHWLGNRTISIQEIGKLSVPTVWTLSDEWLFQATDHYTFDVKKLRWSQRLTNHWIAGLKSKHLSPRLVIAKSFYVARKGLDSNLGKRVPFAVLPNPIDTDVWTRGAKVSPPDPGTLTLIYGFSGREAGFRKGEDLAVHLAQEISRIGIHFGITKTVLLLFGDARYSLPATSPDNLTVTHLGRLKPADFREHLASADFLLAPSRIDNSPNIVLESMAMRTPVISRAESGAEELLVDGASGIVWQPGESVTAVSERILKLNDRDRTTMGCEARRTIESQQGERAYAEQFATLIRFALGINRVGLGFGQIEPTS